MGINDASMASGLWGPLSHLHRQTKLVSFFIKDDRIRTFSDSLPKEISVEIKALSAVTLPALIVKQVAIRSCLLEEKSLNLTLFPITPHPPRRHRQLPCHDDVIYPEEPPLLISLIGNSTKLDVLPH